MIIEGIFFLDVRKNISCGYSLELFGQGDFNEYPQHIKTLMGIHLNNLAKAILMNTHNIRFHGDIWEIIPKLSSNIVLNCLSATV